MEREVTFKSGELVLEGVLNIPESKGPFPAVIICHPHPLYGGSMDNNVVNSLEAAISQASLVSLKFNFRGVGRSQGVYCNGIGEQEDVGVAISFVSTLDGVDPRRIGLAGYSAGAAFGLPVACADNRVKALAGVSPPLRMFDFGFLKNCLKPKFIISGSNDDFTIASSFIQFSQSLPQPVEYEIVEGAAHFWWGYESELARKVTDFFVRELKHR